MGDLRVAVKGSFRLDWDEILSMVELKVGAREAQRAARREVQFIVQEACARYLDAPYISETTLALHLCKEGLADPKPGWSHPELERWTRINGAESTS